MAEFSPAQIRACSMPRPTSCPLSAEPEEGWSQRRRGKWGRAPGHLRLQQDLDLNTSEAQRRAPRPLPSCACQSRALAMPGRFAPLYLNRRPISMEPPTKATPSPDADPSVCVRQLTNRHWKMSVGTQGRALHVLVGPAFIWRWSRTSARNAVHVAYTKNAEQAS